MPSIKRLGGDLPIPLGGGAAVGVAPSDVDILIDRIPFWLAVSADFPYRRETAPYQREQIDQSPEAGEQSLAGWWVRSQMSFHYGAGLEFLDSTARPEPVDRLRFDTSRNVDVWTPGSVTPLPATAIERANDPGEKVWIEQAEGMLVVATDTKVETWDGATWEEFDIGSTFPIQAFTIDGASYYAATAEGVFTGALDDPGTPGTELWTLPGTTVPMCLGWVKQRLMLGHGPDVYSLDTTGPALPTAQLTHPVDSWGWTAFTDSPGGILALGYAGLTSGIFVFALEDVAGTPTLGAGVALISLPGGERVLSGLFYIGSLLVLGTNRGIRVCPFDSFYGTMSLGPLVVETEAPVTALGGFDRFVWAGTLVNGETSLVRVDLSAPLDQLGHYAWAPDLVFPDGDWTDTVTSISFLADGRKAIGVTGRGVVLEGDEPSEDLDGTWLQTAKIRMSTVEDKHWAYAKVRGFFTSECPIVVAVLASSTGDTWTTVRTLEASDDRFGLHAATGEWLALRFSMCGTAELNSYQVQALPGGRRQRLLALPVNCFDTENTRSGIEVGYPGWAVSRLAEIEQLEASGAEVTLTAPALFEESVRAVIERLVYVQPYNPGDQRGGTGGILQITLRTTA
jgi:hypothetical protein